MIALPCAAAALAALALPHVDEPGAAPIAESVLRSYDLAAFDLPYDQHDGRGFVPYTSAFTRAVEHDGDTCMSADLVTDLVGRLLGEELEYEGRGLWVDERGRLVVLGPESVQADVARVVAFLERALTAELELRVDRIVLDGVAASQAPDGGVVSAEAAGELRALAGKGVRRESQVLRLRPGATARMQRTREFQTLIDYDVEIAQGAAISDPIVAPVAVGVELAVRAAPAPGGLSLALMAQCADPPEKPRRLRHPSRSLAGGESYTEFLDAPQATQSVDLLARSLALNSFLPDGKALVLRSDAALGGRGAELLVIERVGGALPGHDRLQLGGEGGRTLELLNAEQVARPRCGAGGMLLESSGAQFLEYMHWARGSEVWMSAHLRSGAMEDVVELLLEFGRTGLELDVDGPWIVGLDDAETRADMREAGLAPVPLERAIEALAEPPAPFVLELALRSAGGAVPAVRCVLPVQAGEDCVISIGREAYEMWDYDVEVAQHSAVPDPQVRTAFDGLYLRAHVALRASGQVAVELQGEARLLTGQAPFTVEGGFYSELDQTIHDVLAFDERLTLEPGGEPIVLGAAEGLSLAVRVAR